MNSVSEEDPILTSCFDGRNWKERIQLKYFPEDSWGEG